MIENASAVISQFAQGRAEVVAACRFFNNHATSISALIEASCAPIGDQVEGRHVLSLQDTSEINYAHHSGMLKASDPHLGPVGNNRDVGFFLHPSLVLDAETGFALGFSDIYLWNRHWDKLDKHARDYRNAPIEQKESYKWLQASTASKKRLEKARHVTIIADREADIYEEFVLVPDAQTDVLIRSRSNRSLADRETMLYQYLEALPEAGSYDLDVTSNNGRQARRAHISVRFAPVRLAKPTSNYHAEDVPASVALYAVEALEAAETVPEGEEPIRWRLLTTHRVARYDEALEVICYYSQRPQIEQVFRLLKRQGLRLEASQLACGVALKKLCVLSLYVVLVLMQLVSARDGGVDEPATLVFEEKAVPFLEAQQQALAGKTEAQQCPHAVGTLAWASWIVGRLGGWDGYARGSPAGPIRMRRGLERLESRYAGWQLARQA